MNQLPNPEEQNSERIPTTISADVHDRINVLRDYIATSDHDPGSKTKYLELLVTENLIDVAVTGYVDGIYDAFTGIDLPEA